MKPLLATKITRERQKIGDWVSSESQATLDGLADFAARQEARRLAVQRPANVMPIKKARG